MDNPKPIPAPSSSLGNLLQGGVEAVRGVVIRAASAHGHYFGQIRQEEEVATTRPRTDSRQLSRGDDVYDIVLKRRGTVIRELKAAAQDGSRRYELVDREGEAWKQKKTRLRKR